MERTGSSLQSLLLQQQSNSAVNGIAKTRLSGAGEGEEKRSTVVRHGAERGEAGVHVGVDPPSIPSLLLICTLKWEVYSCVSPARRGVWAQRG